MRVVRIYHAGRDTAHRERDRALVRAGVDLTLIVPAEWPGNEAPIEDEPFEVVELPVLRPGDVNRHQYRDVDDITDVLDRVQPDVIDLHEEPFSSVAHQILRRIGRGVPAVSYAAQNIDKRFPPPFAQWEKSALSRLGGIYPCTRQAASVVVGKGFAGHVQVLPLAPPPQIVAGSQAAPTDELRMLLVGRLVPEKGITDAVETLAALRGHNARLTIVGDGPERDTAQELAARLGVDGKHAQPGYEDAYYYMLRERRLPVNVDVLDNRIEDEMERERVARVFERGLKSVIGHALPIRAAGGGR